MNETLKLDASQSYSPKGTIVSYEWNFGDTNITSVTNQTVEHAYRSVGNYMVTLNVTDTNGLWNTTSRKVTVTYTADLNKDGTVNIQDITIVAVAFGSKPGDPNWNPIADLDKNGTIDIVDITMIAIDYGKTV